MAKKCIRSWKKYCPDYQIIEWNENNYDISAAPLFVQQAIEAKKWAFAVDYIRYDVVYKYGGIYFDTDVQVLKKLDFLLKDKAFFGMQFNNVVASGLGFGSEAGAPILRDLMNSYLDAPFFCQMENMIQRHARRGISLYLKNMAILLEGQSRLSMEVSISIRKIISVH